MNDNTNETNGTVVKKINKKNQKGKWGKIGAPPKAVNWPDRPFTMATLVSRNPKQCSLSLRNKTADRMEVGDILSLESKPQPGGKVGRPLSVYVLKEHYDPATMILAVAGVKKPKTDKPTTPKKVKKVKKVKKITVTEVEVITPTPAVAPTVPVTETVMVEEAVPASPVPQTAPETVLPTVDITPVTVTEPVIG